jgi:SNF2 family DNA or RNA helicase
MAVSKRVVEDFLKRPLKRSGKAKRFSEAALDRKIRKLLPRPRFNTKPYRHQKICFLLGLKRESYLLFLEMGLGKSKVTLDLFNYRRKQKKARRAIVLVPNVSNVGAWEEEIEKHSPGLEAIGIDFAGREERMDALKRGDLVIVTYMGWLRMLCDNVEGKLVLNKSYAKEFSNRFQFIVFDECTAMKNHQSLTYRTAHFVAKRIRFKFGLTGTPFDKDPQDLWSQFKVIDQGETLGQSLGLFRECFCTAEKDYWSNYPKYTFDKRKKKKLRRMLENRSIFFGEKECLDLPPTVGGIEHGLMTRPVPFEAHKYHEKLVEEVRASKGNYQLLKNSYIRMRQLASGFLSFKDDEEKIKVTLPKNPKLDALVDLLKELLEGKGKIIVFNEFIHSGELISKQLEEEEIKHWRIYSKTKRKNEKIKAFKESGGRRVLVGSRSISYGLNLQCASYIVFFESPDSCIVRRQTERRIRRPGQERKTFIYDLVVKGSIEEKILTLLVEGKDLHDALLEGKEVLM